ncbi:hypothetical protein DUI87_04296 [Hirundo rustica rustica]|uniref:Uncharacterized protein n=1 Tax=Hirundo rustica rustica TaxID=333673 RepID=A0A3M0KYN5_HIRRU|nr:hypothetical protein DUI87_04296 [Hirundo rustica rustica]
MAGRGFSLFKVFRGNTKKRPAAALAQQPEEPEQLQPLQDGEDRTPEQDPARDSLPQAGEDQTPEQDPARGRFRRALKILRRFLRLRHRNTTTAASEATARPDCRPTELRAEPGASTAPTEGAANSARATAEGRAKADVALTEAVASTNTHTPGISKMDATPTQTGIPALPLEFSKEKGGFHLQQASSLGPGLKASQGAVAPQATSAGPPQPLRLSTTWWEGKRFSREAGEVALLDSTPSLPHAFSRCQPW